VLGQGGCSCSCVKKVLISCKLSLWLSPAVQLASDKWGVAGLEAG
jgi:hypothetical protein